MVQILRGFTAQERRVKAMRAQPIGDRVTEIAEAWAALYFQPFAPFIPDV